MPTNPTLARLRDVLRVRLKLKAPNDEVDSIYKYEDEELESCIIFALNIHNPTYTIETLPPNEEPFVLWLAEIEIYFGLATGNSRFFTISAEGASIRKSERVDHYLKLIEGRQKLYDSMWAHFNEVNPNLIDVEDIYVRSPHTLHRAWRFSDRPSISLEAVRKTTNSVDLSWSEYKKTRANTEVYYGTELIIDEWETPTWSSTAGIYVPINPTANLLTRTDNPFKNKLRVKDLEPSTKYHFAVIVVDRHGKWGHQEIEVTTEG